MKFAVLMVMLVFARSSFAAEEIPRRPLEWRGKKLVFSHYVMHFVGGPSQHFILVHEDIPIFAEVRLALAPVPPGLPCVKVGTTRFPLGGAGVYLLSKHDDAFDVSVAIWGSPDRTEQKSIERFISNSLDGFEERRKSVERTNAQNRR